MAVRDDAVVEAAVLVVALIAFAFAFAFSFTVSFVFVFEAYILLPRRIFYCQTTFSSVSHINCNGWAGTTRSFMLLYCIVL